MRRVLTRLMPDLSMTRGGRSRERRPIAVIMMPKLRGRGLAAGVKGEAPKKLLHLMDLYRQQSVHMTHADIIAMNRSLNPLD